MSRSQWPRGRRHGSASAGLLGLRVRIPPEGMAFCLVWVLCVVRYRSLRRADHSSTGIIPTVLCLRCTHEVSIRKRGHRPTTGRSATGKKLINKLLCCHFRCFRSGVSEEYVLLVDTVSLSYRFPVVWGNVELSEKNSSATFRPLKMVTPCCLETSGSDTQWHGVMPQKKNWILSFKFKPEQKGKNASRK
jgi:hypothetical protein